MLMQWYQTKPQGSFEKEVISMYGTVDTEYRVSRKNTEKRVNEVVQFSEQQSVA